MKALRIVGVLVFLLFMLGSASACNDNCYYNNVKYSLDLQKSANTSTYDHAGQVIEYTYTVKNTGINTRTQKATITGTIEIRDDKIPDMVIKIDDDLEVGASVTRTATYVIKSDDLRRYSVLNTATATTKVGSTTI
jgi:uncharacterized repeat protein (TIGR01451 family)